MPRTGAGGHGSREMGPRQLQCAIRRVGTSYEFLRGSLRNCTLGRLSGKLLWPRSNGPRHGWQPALFVPRPLRRRSGTDYGFQPGKLVPDGTCHIPFGGAEITQGPPFEVLYATGGGRPPWNPPYPPSYPYPPYPPAQVQPFPPCKLGDPGVGLDVNTGWWVGANCSSIDSQGRITQLKYPQPAQPPPYTPPPPPYDPGPSSVTWQPAQKPFVPGQNAIMGGPGNGPKPGSPLYVCRVQYNNNLFPGKWVEGACNFSDDAGKEQVSNTYEVATGSAEWRDFDGNVGALVPGGVAADGTHLFICRKQISTWGSNRGLQPGWLENGQCHIPYNVDLVNGMPFQALYNVFGPPGANNPQNQGPAAQAQTAAPGQGPSQSHGILISFAGGTAATPRCNYCDEWRHGNDSDETIATKFHRATMHGDSAAGCAPSRPTDSNPGWGRRVEGFWIEQCRKRYRSLGCGKSVLRNRPRTRQRLAVLRHKRSRIPFVHIWATPAGARRRVITVMSSSWPKSCAACTMESAD